MLDRVAPRVVLTGWDADLKENRNTSSVARIMLKLRSEHPNDETDASGGFLLAGLLAQL